MSITALRIVGLDPVIDSIGALPLQNDRPYVKTHSTQAPCPLYNRPEASPRVPYTKGQRGRNFLSFARKNQEVHYDI